MVVTRSNFSEIITLLSTQTKLSLDTETTGLRVYHGDRLFSLAIASPGDTYYFNFGTQYVDVGAEVKLTPSHLKEMSTLWSDPTKIWYLHNAKFDMGMLANEGICLLGTVHCTKAISRLVYNAHMDYSLDACAKRIGLEKSDAVEQYVTEHNLWEYEDVPGKNTRKKRKHFDQVPFGIISEYAQKDARITFDLARSQEENKDLPLKLVENERALTKTLFSIEQTGLLIDPRYCREAIAYETSLQNKALEEFKLLTGKPYKASPLLFKEVFADQKDLWEYGEETKTGQINPSFESEVLEKFNSPIARSVLALRTAKSKCDFYHGFLYHMDGNGRVHPNLNQDGTATGRLSSSDPNFQNLTSDDDSPYLIRRAIIPTPSFILYMIDFDQMEYKLMLDYAASLVGFCTPLITDVKSGKDVHQATADLVKSVSSLDIGRSKAKNGNFAKLYGAGINQLAATLKCDRAGAIAVSNAIEAAAPEIAQFCSTVSRTAQIRGDIRNWMGRRSYFPNGEFSYKAPNYLIQGGCADIVKIAMNQIADYLKDKKSRMVLMVHDEVVLEVHESEVGFVPKRCKEILEGVYPYKYLPLTASMERSHKSMADGEAA